MRIDEAIDILSDNHTVLYSHGDYTEQEESKALSMAIKSLKAWEKIDDEIASLRDTYLIGTTYTEKLICENLQAVRKTIHEYRKEVSE